jgi:formate dehydrogenase maturation protein FdhE
MSDFYKVRVHCGNCDTKSNIEIIEGKRVSEEECPNCGCPGMVLISEPSL